ncbi:c-type cytochrome [Fimbriiglobus ruber]|uniref:c-type cytochrome n=1 Tax=Fimbriiglobus ruber TaxID=1908690 RepID=UPI00117BA211|nr:c-type cytochrome [Fimbriiglobus ruber]
MFRLALLMIIPATALMLGGGTVAQEKAKAQAKKPQPKREATPAEDLAVPAGFHIELLHTSDAATEGSWINMCKDGKGRLIVGGQRSQPVLRFTITDGKVSKEEKLDLPISETMGLLYAYDSLYVVGAGPGAPYGLFRCKDTKGTDQYDEVKLLKNLNSGGEHGAHAVLLGPDKKIWVICGNHTGLPAGLSAESPHQHFAEDHVLPRQWDGNGHAAGILAPGGYVVRTDPDGKEWELLLAGFRNAYDMAFNADGELFTFDSDMEWDWGMPWYRPTRINHCTSASESGWRSGTGKWPEYYADSLPATDNIGVGSPTGVTNGIGAKFPAKYQKAIFALDWTYGRIFAVHLTPHGSSYIGTHEVFVAPKGLVGNGPKKPLNVTDAVIGDDGSLYFTTGGRNTQSGLYRVTYTGSESTAPADLHDAAGATDRKLRHEIEAFHGKKDPKAVATAWPHLGSEDRFLRYAARVAIEFQAVAEWKSKLLTETNPTAAINAALAIARVGDFAAQVEMFTALEKFPLSSLTDEQKLEKLRVLEVSFSRHGQPTGTFVNKVAAEVDGQFPSANEFVNREAVQILIYLQSPKVLAKALTLMANAKTQEDRFHYLFHLRTLPVGFWTLDQRKEYLGYWTKDAGKMAHPPQVLKWFEEAGRGYSDGASFANFKRNFLKEYVLGLSPAEKKELDPIINAIDKAANVVIEAKVRPFVKKWAMDDLVSLLPKASSGRNFEKGKQAFVDAQCAKCHRFGDFGGSVGPDLTAIASRFDKQAILESILEPSKVLSEQYQNEQFNTFSGQSVIGRVVDESADKVAVQPDPLDQKRVEIKKADIETRKASKLSPMPANLADVLTTDDILDLIAFLESGGRKQHPAFKK